MPRRPRYLQWTDSACYHVINRGHARERVFQHDKLLAPNPWYEQMASDTAGRQKRWREFLSGDDPHEATIRDENWVKGNATFRRNAAHEAGRPVPRAAGRPGAINAQTH